MLGRTEPHKYPEYADLADNLEVAHAQRTIKREQFVLLAAAGGDWRAAAWLEERQNPRQYGDPKTPLSDLHEPPPGQLFDSTQRPVDLSVLSDEELEQAHALSLRIASSTRDDESGGDSA